MKKQSASTFPFLLSLVFLLGLVAPLYAQDWRKVGLGSFPFEDAAHRVITVWYYAPASPTPDCRVLFVMHGVERNAQHYRDSWVENARRKHAILLVPEFSNEAFPGSDQYNLGAMFSPSGTLNDRSEWTFTSIERIFQRVKADANLRTATYSIYGHSAGAQFVHRMVLFMPEASIERAVAANAGWYTMPELNTPFPYGLKDAPITQGELGTALERRLMILLGGKDTDENDKHLRNSPEAIAQGDNRLERGMKFFKNGQAEARELGVKCQWRTRVVPNVGHNSEGMSPEALQFLF